MCLAYEQDAPPVLKNINLDIKPGEKVGNIRDLLYDYIKKKTSI